VLTALRSADPHPKGCAPSAFAYHLPCAAAEGAFFKKKGSEAVVIKQKFSLLTFLSHSIVIFVKF